jgi:hypothetical protein
MDDTFILQVVQYYFHSP